MARTVAQVAAQVDLHEEKLAVVDRTTADLWVAVERLTEREQTARLEAVGYREQLAQVRKELDREREQSESRDRAIAELRQENALLRQRFDDHRKGVETWSGRLWTLVTILVGALIGAALTAARK